MGFQIESGSGNGQLVHVQENRLSTSAVIQNFINFSVQEYQDAYAWSHSYDSDATDTVILVSNSSTTKDLYIHRITFGSDTATEWTLHCPAYPSLAGTALTGVNLNRKSGNLASAEAYGDETGNTQANVVSRGFVAANSAVVIDVAGAIVLGYHNCIAIDIVAAATKAVGTIVGFYMPIGVQF